MRRRDRDRALEVPDRVVPIGDRHETAAEQRLGEEALNRGEPLHLGMPGAEDVVSVVVVGVDRDRPRRLVEDDLRVAHPLLTAFGAGEPAQHHR